MPLNGCQVPDRVDRFDGFDYAIVGPGDRAEAGCDGLDGLMVDRIDDGRGSDDPTELGTGFDDDGLVPIERSSIRDVVVLAVGTLRRQIYPEGAAEGNVDELSPPADGQSRYSLVPGGASQGQFPVVALVVDFTDDAWFLPSRMVVMDWVDVASPGEYQAVEESHDIKNVLRVLLGHHHRDTTGTKDPFAVVRDHAVNGSIANRCGNRKWPPGDPDDRFSHPLSLLVCAEQGKLLARHVLRRTNT